MNRLCFYGFSLCQVLTQALFSLWAHQESDDIAGLDNSASSRGEQFALAADGHNEAFQ